MLGDNIYGEPRIQGVPRLCLHCSHMAVAHPRIPGEVISASAPLPPDLAALVERQLQEAASGGRQNRRGSGESANAEVA